MIMLLMSSRFGAVYKAMYRGQRVAFKTLKVRTGHRIFFLCYRTNSDIFSRCKISVMILHASSNKKFA